MKLIKRFFFLGLFILHAPALWAQSPEWKPFSSSQDGFSVDFPGTPRMTQEKDPEFIIKRFTVTNPGRGFFVQVSHAGETIPEKFVGGIMSSLRDGLAQGLKGKISEEKPVKCGGSAGQSFVIISPEGWSANMICAAGPRMYLIHAASHVGP